jgi:hypothetical protein
MNFPSLRNFVRNKPAKLCPAIITMVFVATTATNTMTKHYLMIITTIIMNNHLEFSFRMSKEGYQED